MAISTATKGHKPGACVLWCNSRGDIVITLALLLACHGVVAAATFLMQCINSSIPELVEKVVIIGLSHKKLCKTLADNEK